MTHVWERFETEGDEPWSVFKEYRDQYPHRNPYTGTLARRLGREKVHNYYNEYMWKDRVLAYDRYFDSIAQAERADSIRQIEKEASPRRKLLADRLLAIAEREVTKLEEAVAEEGPRMRPNEVLKVVELATKLGTLLDGQPTEIHGSTDVDFSKLSVEELRKWKELREKAKKTG
jgi:hypothetical protein